MILKGLINIIDDMFNLTYDRFLYFLVIIGFKPKRI